jgi:hypothetical protein
MSLKNMVSMLVAVALLWPVVAKAQPPRGRGPEGSRDERIARVIRDCEQRTDDFLRAVQNAWGRDRHNGDPLDRDAARLEQALNRVRDAWNRDHDYRRARGYVGSAVDAGRRVNRLLPRHRLGRRVEKEWAAIRVELDHLAEAFDQPRIRW